jgi:hypothetical protein
MKKKTIVDYGTDDGNYNDGSESFKKKGYISLYNKETNSLSELENNNDEKKKAANKQIKRAQNEFDNVNIEEANAKKQLADLKASKEKDTSITDNKKTVTDAETALKELWIKSWIKYIKDIIDRETEKKNVENKKIDIENKIKNIEKELNIEKEELPKAEEERDKALQQREGLKKSLQRLQNELENLELEKKNAKSDKEYDDIVTNAAMANANYKADMALYEEDVKIAKEKWNIVTSKRTAIENKEGKLSDEKKNLNIAEQELEIAKTAITEARDKKELFTNRNNFKDNIMIQSAISTLNKANAELEIVKIKKHCEFASRVAQANEKINSVTAKKNTKLKALDIAKHRLKIIEGDYKFNLDKNQENKDILTDIISREEQNDKEKLYYYFNLRTMKSEKIENIDANILTEERFKYILVDDNNNKLPYDETAKDLIKFTKIYSKNEKYNINIINDIFYAKNNREKLFI